MVFRYIVLLAVVAAAAAQAADNSSVEVPVKEVEEQDTAPILPSLIASSVALFQGRNDPLGRGKKGGQGLGLAMMMGGMMVAMALAALAALSGKAMAASMAALMLAAMSLLKKHSGGHSSYEVISVPGHHHRSLKEGDGYTGYGADEPSTHSGEVADRLENTG